MCMAHGACESLTYALVRSKLILCIGKSVKVKLGVYVRHIEIFVIVFGGGPMSSRSSGERGGEQQQQTLITFEHDISR